MKSTVAMCVLVVFAGFSGSTHAGYWADMVVDWSDDIQDYNGIRMDEATTWWLTGPSDDVVAGWRSRGPDEFFVVGWEMGLLDVEGDDLTIRLYSGSEAQGRVSASTDGVNFLEIGTIGGGTPLVFREESFDFAGLFDGPVYFVKVERLSDAASSGVFIDSVVGMAVIPEPATLCLLGLGAVSVLSRKRRLQ